MKTPKMIIFDYGNTLLWEPDWNTKRGNEKLLESASENPYNCTVDDIVKGAELIFGEHIEAVRSQGYDITGQVGNRALYDYLGIKFDLSPVEIETLFWDAASSGAIVPNTDTILDYLNENGIRTAVISNLLWSSEALTIRLDRLLPNNRFEFVMTSSDYMFRKPNRILFEIALRKAGLNAEEVWYCGDSPECDVDGSSQTGIFPVWYDNQEITDFSVEKNKIPPTCKHLHIKDWTQLIAYMENLKKV